MLAQEIVDELFNERKERLGTNAAAIHDLRCKLIFEGRLSCVGCEAFEEEVNATEVDHRFAGVGAARIVFAQAA